MCVVWTDFRPKEFSGPINFEMGSPKWKKIKGKLYKIEFREAFCFYFYFMIVSHFEIERLFVIKLLLLIKLIWRMLYFFIY